MRRKTRMRNRRGFVARTIARVRRNRLFNYFVFLFGGGCGFLLNLATTFVLTEFVHLWYIISYFFGCLVNFTFNYSYHRLITFKAKNKVFDELKRFFSVYVVVFVISVFSVYVLTDFFHVYYLLSIILVTLVVSIFNYLANKIWVFRKR